MFDFLARDHGERLRMQREHRAQVAERAVLLERAEALGRVELHVGLRDAELDLAGLDRLTLDTEPPVDSTEQRMPCLARSRLTRRQIAPPAG